MPLWLDTLTPVFLPKTKVSLESTFCNSCQLFHHVGLNLLNFIEFVTLQYLYNFWQQPVIARPSEYVGCGNSGMFSQKCIMWGQIFEQCIVMVQESNCWCSTSQGDVCTQCISWTFTSMCSVESVLSALTGSSSKDRYPILKWEYI